MVFEVAQGPRSGVHPGFDQRRVVLAPHGEAFRVDDGVFARVLDAGARHVVVAGQPHDATGHRGGAADHVAFLDDENVRAAVVGEGGGGEGRTAGSDHYDVDQVVPAFGETGQHGGIPRDGGQSIIHPRRR